MRIRPAQVGDAAALALVHVRTWQAAYRGQMPQEYLDQLDPVQRRALWKHWIQHVAPRAGTCVLEHEADGVIGFISVSPSRDDDADPATIGEVTAIYLLPTHWGSGGGRMLMGAGLRHLADAGYASALLWVLETNTRARRFYEAGGWQPDGTSKVDDTRGFPLAEVRYRRHIAA